MDDVDLDLLGECSLRSNSDNVGGSSQITNSGRHISVGSAAASAELHDVFIFDSATSVSLEPKLSQLRHSSTASQIAATRPVAVDDLLNLSDWNAVAPVVVGTRHISFTKDDAWPKLDVSDSINVTTSTNQPADKSSALVAKSRHSSLSKLINHAPLRMPDSNGKIDAPKATVGRNLAMPPPIERTRTKFNGNFNGTIPNGYTPQSIAPGPKLPESSDHMAKNSGPIDHDNESSLSSDMDEDDVFLTGPKNFDKNSVGSVKKSKKPNNYDKPAAKFRSNLAKQVRFFAAAKQDDREDSVKFEGFDDNDFSAKMARSQLVNVGGSKFGGGGDKLLLKRPGFVGYKKRCHCAAAWLAYLLLLNVCLAIVVCSIIYVPSVVNRVIRVARGGQNSIIAPCSRIDIVYDRNLTLSQIYPTSPVYAYSLNLADDRRFVVFGFGSLNLPCETRASCQRRGGVVCVDPTSMSEIWRLLTVDEVIGVACGQDVNGDAFGDCVVGGRSGILKMINGRNGTIIWEFLSIIGNNRKVLEPQYVRDMDNDGYADLLVTADSEIHDKPELMLYLISGKTGTSIASTADILSINSMKADVPAVKWSRGDSGVDEVILSAGTVQMPGGLSVFSLRALERGLLEKNNLLLSNVSILTRPLVVDLNLDGLGDLVICTLAGEISAYSGRLPHITLWRYKRPNGQCISELLSGYFNNDTYPDIVVTFNSGSKSTELDYSSAETLLIDGLSGSVIKSVLTSTPPPNLRLARLRMSGFGNDVIVGFKHGCGVDSSTSAALKLPPFFYDSNPPRNPLDLSSIDFCQYLTDDQKHFIELAVVGSTSTKLVDSGDFIKKIVEADSSAKTWFTSNGLEAPNMLLHAGNAVAGNVSTNGSHVTVLFPTFWQSSSDTTLYPKECFKFEKEGYIVPSLQSEHCKKFVNRFKSDRKLASYDGYGTYYGAGYTVLHRVILKCKCENEVSGQCATFL